MNETDQANCNPATVPAPPYSPEIEQAVLAQMLAFPDQALVRCIMRLTPKHFFDDKHRILFTILRGIFDRKEPVDPLAVEQYFLDKVTEDSGSNYVRNLCSTASSLTDLDSYFRILEEKHLLRSLIEASQRFIARAAKEPGSVMEAWYELEAAVCSAEGIGCDPHFYTMPQVTRQLDYLKDEQRRAAILQDCIPTGFAELDRLTGGLRNGGLFLLAGGESPISALAIALAVRAASRVPVGYFSLKMPTNTLGFRLVASEARVSLESMAGGPLTQDDWQRIEVASNTIAALPIFVDESPRLSIRQLRCHVHELKKKHGIGFIIIDGLQYIALDSDDSRTTLPDVLHLVANEFFLPVVVTTRYDHPYEKGKPRPSDLREAGVAGTFRGWVAMLYEELTDKSKTEIPQESAHYSLIVSHERLGIAGEIPLIFWPGYSHFESPAKPAGKTTTGQNSQSSETSTKGTHEQRS